MLAPGSNTITGSALMRQRGGGVVTCAGNSVTLVPATEYAKHRVAAIYGMGKMASFSDMRVTISPNPPEYVENTRTTQCNAQGFFKFEHVADGDFFIHTMIVWTAGRYDSRQGGGLIGRAAVRGGQTLEVTMAP